MRVMEGDIGMTKLTPAIVAGQADYTAIRGEIVILLETTRRIAARNVNALMTTSYWDIGRRIVEFEQGGKDHAELWSVIHQKLGCL